MHSHSVDSKKVVAEEKKGSKENERVNKVAKNTGNAAQESLDFVR